MNIFGKFPGIPGTVFPGINPSMRFARYARLLKNGRFHDSKFSLAIQSSQTSIIKNEMDEQRVEVMITDRDQVLQFKAVIKPVFFFVVQSDPV